MIETCGKQKATRKNYSTFFVTRNKLSFILLHKVNEKVITFHCTSTKILKAKQNFKV